MAHHDARSILIVDDDTASLALMDQLARQQPRAETRLFTNPFDLLAVLGTLDYDVAIFSLSLPGLDGIALTRQVKSQARLAAKPVVIVTPGSTPLLNEEALAAGAAEFLRRPIEPAEFTARLATLTRLAEAERNLARERQWNWTDPAREGGVLRLSEDEIVSVLARAAGYKDRETPMHITRMACYCAILAHHLGLADDSCADIRLAAPLHDIGKAGLREDVLRKRGLLDPAERQHMEAHTRIGHEILSTARSGVLRLAAEIALTHHERWDGSGYPHGLKGQQIPLSGRIAAVADVFDALTSERSYKGAWTLNNAFNYLQEHAGQHFDPACVAAFQLGRDEVAAVLAMMPDPGSGAAADAA